VVVKVIKLQSEDIDVEKILELVKSPSSGGVVSFLGTVRDNAKGHSVEHMNIEVYEEMAYKQLEAIESEALEKYGVHKIMVVHRHGDLKVGDNIVFIAVAAGHREEAFDACRYIIDELKQRVPIWKKETTPEGEIWVEGEKRE
jgi:molybdopterin synthase catalytic subunit